LYHKLGDIIMVDEMVRNISKKTYYRLSLYLNIVLFFIVGLFFYLLVKDCIDYGEAGGETWLNVTRDVAILSIALALIFFQFVRNLFIIMRRSL
jgi:hypothetical protein